MFDPSGCTGAQLAARLVANEADLRARECEVLVLAAGWADVHDVDTTAPHPRRRPRDPVRPTRPRRDARPDRAAQPRPLARGHHRAVTHRRWQPEPGTHVFRTPHGYVYVVTNQGSLSLGSNDFAAHVWHRATQQTHEQTAA